MIDWDVAHKPLLRPLEAFRADDIDDGMIGLRDPSGLSDFALTLSEGAAFIVGMMDGQRTCGQILDDFHSQAGHALSVEQLHSMLQELEKVHFLEGPSFQTYYRSLVDDYLSAPARAGGAGSALEILADSDD